MQKSYTEFKFRVFRVMYVVNDKNISWKDSILWKTLLLMEILRQEYNTSALEMFYIGKHVLSRKSKSFTLKLFLLPED